MAERRYNPIREEWQIPPNPEGRLWKTNPAYKEDAFELVFGVKP